VEEVLERMSGGLPAVTVTLWRVAADTPQWTAEDMAGKGAAAKGARWNHAGAHVAYASMSISLAAWETRAHFGKGARLPWNRYLVRIDVPEDCLGGKTNHGSTARGRLGCDSRGTRVSFRGICLAEGEPDRIARRPVGQSSTRKTTC